MQNAYARTFPLLALALLAACGGGGGAASRSGAGADVPEAQRFGGTAVVSAIGEIPDVNPLTSSDQSGNNVQMFVLFTPVVAYNDRLEPVPALAKSWELNADSTELTFHLRGDVYWQDGVKTTAQDLKFAYDMAKDPKTAYPNSNFFTHYGTAEAPDSFTFKVRLTPHAEFMDPWRTFFAVPRHILQGTKPEEMKNHPFGTKAPVGNGPFRFVSHAQGQQWVFEANPRYPKELGGRPYLDRLVYRVIPEPATNLNELLSGNVDYYINPPAEQTPRIKSSAAARLETFPDRSFTIIAWNERRPFFKDARVRRALTMAINRQAIIDGVLYGYGTLAASTVPPFYWQYDPQAGADLKYDPEGAKRLLAQAGWTDRNGDGTIEDASGRPFRFTMKSNQGNQIRADIAVRAQSDLRKVGIDVQPQIVEWGTLLDQLQTPSRRDFDAVAIGWTTEFRIDDTDLFSCRKMGGPFQWVGYCDPQVDRMLDTLQTIPSRAAAKPVWEQYQRKIAADVPFTFIDFDQRREGVSNRLRNVHPDARGDLVGAAKWYITPEARRAH
ncbi:MAG TPA: ABC transporter substrate-binding protein [Longimicrobiaceae bacterium]|jgi:peptide/nickel transport system substrate-binding protein|nr:ABC transporter substrate-binding protein [Longimicrobiaceae bacterium]